MKRFTTYFVAGLVLVLALIVCGQATQPATQATDGPAISADAQKLLDGVKDAYSKVSNLELTGELSIKLDAGGVKSNDKTTFTSSFQAPDKFRHEAKDDILLVSNNEKAFLYKPDVKKYVSLDAPKERQEFSNLPMPIAPLLMQQNPSLLMAMLTDASSALKVGATKIETAPDAAIDGKNFNVLRIKADGKEMSVYVDPATRLVRRVQSDLRERLNNVGVAQVHDALFTIDYSNTSSNVQMEAGRFAWNPPTDAMLIKLQADSAFDSDGEEAALALVGKAAPAFTLKDLGGNDVSLGSLKGSVVVLDFWATWCGPCRMSLPHLNDLNKELSGRGLKVFAVNQAETKGAVADFMKAEKLTLPVLLDESSSVGNLYKVSGIPQTVVIGKDGIIRKVFIGFGPGSEVELRKAVDAAMQ